jgi:hypothetical protein
MALDHIPEFPQFCELTPDLAAAVRPALYSIGPTISEFTFANLFLFRKAHGYRVSRMDQLLLVAGHGYDGRIYGFPPIGVGPVDEAALRLCDYLASHGASPVLFPVPRGMLESNYSGSRWRAEADRDQADYVYLREELATLSGKRFHKRKNRLLKYLREEAQDYSYGPLEDEHLDDCLELASGWCQIRCSADRPSTFLETGAAIEALRLRAELGLRGGVILLEGKARAFCLGEPLNPETFVVHFEKAEAAKDGLAQLINRDFCLLGLPGYRYVNREQDLGDSGLRQAKEAYRPVFLEEKYRVVPA